MRCHTAVTTLVSFMYMDIFEENSLEIRRHGMILKLADTVKAAGDYPSVFVIQEKDPGRWTCNFQCTTVAWKLKRCGDNGKAAQGRRQAGRDR